MYVYMCKCVFMYVCVFMCVNAYLCLYVYVCVYTWIDVFVCVCACLRMCVHNNIMWLLFKNKTKQNKQTKNNQPTLPSVLKHSFDLGF